MTELMKSRNIQYIVEETYLENDFNHDFEVAKHDVFEKIEKTDECDKCNIIELRNEHVLAALSDKEKAVSSILTSFGNIVFAKETSFSAAFDNLFKINLLLGSEHELKDLYCGAELVCDEKCENDKDKIFNVKFDHINIGLVNEFKTKLEQYVSICHDCLFEDLYDAEMLKKYLPVVYMFLYRYSY